MANSDNLQLEDVRKEVSRDEAPARRSDGIAASVLRGVTVRDILRTHELLRRFGWSHLLERRR